MPGRVSSLSNQTRDRSRAEQIVGPERGERLSQLARRIRRLDVIASPGQLGRSASCSAGLRP